MPLTSLLPLRSRFGLGYLAPEQNRRSYSESKGQGHVVILTVGVGTGGSLQALKHPTEMSLHGEATAKMRDMRQR